eukprot:6758481-Prymnesium_polylepis.1
MKLASPSSDKEGRGLNRWLHGVAGDCDVLAVAACASSENRGRPCELPAEGAGAGLWGPRARAPHVPRGLLQHAGGTVQRRFCRTGETGSRIQGFAKDTVIRSTKPCVESPRERETPTVLRDFPTEQNAADVVQPYVAEIRGFVAILLRSAVRRT